MAVPTIESSHVLAWRERRRARGQIAETTYGYPGGAISEPEWLLFAPVIADIERLKIERNAVILAHNYQTPEIFHGIADFQGDSLSLAREAAQGDADVIVMCGVSFMAETAKLLNPGRTVLLPDTQAGCSLAEAIGPEDVRELRRRHPGVPVICYVNTSAAVKAECDVCCTSANAVAVVESLGSESVILVPDEYLARYVASQTDVEIISWHGHCEVHVRFSAVDIAECRSLTGAYVLAHPECPDDVQRAADYVGSTSGMIAELAARRPASALLLTECSMSDNVAAVHPEIRFLRPCNLCPHMKRITLANIRDCLEHLRPQVDVPDEVAPRARRAVLRMLELTAARRATSVESSADPKPGGLVGV
ncbi:MAG: quinolinate synthase NadA [Gammaproteobacteria bacterium]|nr:quinolinate synthase NadA [Gammaproteobacteria bacterium]